MVEVYIKNKKGVGTIGARLHFEDNTIQHAGIITFLGQKNNNYHVGLSHQGIKSYYNYSTNKKEVFGNTAAFLMITKKLFDKINGFREIYKECFEDVHLNIDCLRVGKKNIFVGDAVCYHYESITRNSDSMRLERESEDYTNRIIPYIINNEVTYKYFTNVKENILKQIFSNEKTTN
jgi:GT2 family glycosyltransferase